METRPGKPKKSYEDGFDTGIRWFCVNVAAMAVFAVRAPSGESAKQKLGYWAEENPKATSVNPNEVLPFGIEAEPLSPEESMRNEVTSGLNGHIRLLEDRSPLPAGSGEISRQPASLPRNQEILFEMSRWGQTVYPGF